MNNSFIKIPAVTSLRYYSGFTLLEVLISITILSILLATVVSQINGMEQQAKITAANTIVASVAKKVDEYYQLHGKWPTEIDIGWFRRRGYPRSPFSPDFVGNTININDSPNKWHPGYKTLDIYQPFWYCRGNGSFRIRVPRQADDVKTIALYNEANRVNVLSMGDQSK